MTLQNFIRSHRTEIDDAIQQASPGSPKDAEERRLWVLNDERLYNWAKSEGVNI